MPSNQIVWPSGYVNRVDDVAIGQSTANALTGTSRFAGQLGDTIWLRESQLRFDPAVGTVYPGRFRYVRLRNADAVRATIGTLAFWDTTLANWQREFQVTQDEDLAASGITATMIAGVFMSTVDHGNYTLIQDVGMIPTLMRAVLAIAGTVNGACFAAGLDTGIGVADNGVATVLDPNAAAAAITDISLMNRRYLGVFAAIPVGGALCNVVMDLRSSMVG